MAKQRTPILEVRNLTVRFHTDGGILSAVNDVSFDVYPGETLGVVGESGSGKSVSSLAIMGLLPQRRTEIKGSIRFRPDGGEPLELIGAPQATFRRLRGGRVAMIFQEPMSSLNPVIRIGDQIAEAITLHTKLTKRQARARAVELLETVGIPEPENRSRAYPHQLSGGMCQRAMIAMALSCEPRLLIADEPTTALDVTIQAQVLDLIDNVQKQFDMAVLFITHDLGVVADIADRVAVMYGGRVVEEGDAETILHQPQHPYTRGLIQSIPKVEGNSERIVPIKGMMPDGRNMPPGCSFHPRCDHAEAGLCDVSTAAASLKSLSDRHAVRCEKTGRIWPIGSGVN